MKIYGSRIDREDAYPILLVETSVGRLVIDAEQKMYNRGFPLVYCGMGMERVLPEIRLNEFPGETFYGFTKNAEVLALFEKFLNEK